jgi:hypothetical protein
LECCFQFAFTNVPTASNSPNNCLLSDNVLVHLFANLNQIERLGCFDLRDPALAMD